MIDRGERRSGAWRGLATNTQRCSTPSRSRFSSSRARPALCVRVVTGRLQGLRQHHHLQRHQHAWGSTLRVGTGKGFALRPSKAGGDPGRVGAQPIPALHSGEFALHAGEFAGTSLRVTGALVRHTIVECAPKRARCTAWRSIVCKADRVWRQASSCIASSCLASSALGWRVVAGRVVVGRVVA